MAPWSDELIEQIYDAILVPSMWDEVCLAMSGALDARVWIEMASIPDVTTSYGTVQVSAGNPLAEPRTPDLRQPAGATARDLPASTIARTFRKCRPLPDLGLSDLLSLELAPPEMGLMPVIYVARQTGEPQFCREDLNALQRLERHLCFAATMRLKSAARAPLAPEYMQALDQFCTGCTLLDGTGGIVYANRAAKAALRRGGLIRLCDGQIRVAKPSCDHEFQAAIRKACVATSAHGRSYSELDFTDALGRPFVVAVRPLGDGNPLVGSLSVIRAAVYFHTVRRPASPELGEQRLRKLYGLSEAMSQVAWDLSLGSTPVEIARARGRSVHTVRVQIRDIFGRTGMKRAGQLQAMHHVLAAPHE